jgi:hypothetical protein
VKPLGRFVLIFIHNKILLAFRSHKPMPIHQQGGNHTISTHKINLAITKNKGIKQTKQS